LFYSSFPAAVDNLLAHESLVQTISSLLLASDQFYKVLAFVGVLLARSWTHVMLQLVDVANACENHYRRLEQFLEAMQSNLEP
jgi:hypothetical protein